MKKMYKYTFIFEPKIPCRRAVWTLGPSFEQASQRFIKQCFKLKHMSLMVLKKRIFGYLFVYFYCSNPGTSELGPIWILGPAFEQTWLRTTRQCYIPNYKHLSKVVLKKKRIFNVIFFSMYFYGSNQKSLGQGHFEPRCKIILKSMHKCTSYGPDKLNI